MTDDPYAAMKAAQREGWSLFAPIAAFTTPAAAALVNYAGVQPGEAVHGAFVTGSGQWVPWREA